MGEVQTINEVSEFKPDFYVKLPSDNETPSPGDPGKSLIREVEKLSERVNMLCIAVKGLCSLMGALDEKVVNAIQNQLKDEALSADRIA